MKKFAVGVTFFVYGENAEKAYDKIVQVLHDGESNFYHFDSVLEDTKELCDGCPCTIESGVHKFGCSIGGVQQIKIFIKPKEKL